MIHALKDKVYRAVEDANKEQDGGYKYHVVGGAAGTVSPSELHNIFYIWSSFPEYWFIFFFHLYNQTVGWTWQGGLAGTTGARRYGMCVYVFASRTMNINGLIWFVFVFMLYLLI